MVKPEREAIVLVGGIGTRLQSVVADVPKPMAPIGDCSFLSLLIERLRQQKFTRVVLSTGHLGHLIEREFSNSPANLEIVFSHEEAPLGTGGAIRQAFSHCQSNPVFVLNGDSFFDIDFAELEGLHHRSRSDITMSLKKLAFNDRYGSVHFGGHSVASFAENSGPVYDSLINGGVYILNRDVFAGYSMPAQFSFERDFLETYVADLIVSGMVSDGYFIDIGIPEDYRRAQLELPNLILNS